MEKQTNERRRRETIDQAIAKKKQQQQRKSATYLRLHCFQTFFKKKKMQYFLRLCHVLRPRLLPVEHNAWSRRDNYVTTPDEKGNILKLLAR